jgi:hypothetical protein
MLDDSAIDLLNYLQSRILVTFDNWAANMREKVKKARQHLVENRSAVYLNSESFYLQYQVKNRWVRLPESINEILQFQSHH